MSRLRAGVVLLLIQLALVLSVAAKFLYERMTRPRVWVRAAQYDPETPLRGRYLALQLLINACQLPHDDRYNADGAPEVGYTPIPSSAMRQLGPDRHAYWYWKVELFASSGMLVPRLVDPKETLPDTYELVQAKKEPCNSLWLRNVKQDLFIPEHAKTPFPLKPGQELWVEVTVPKQGPPRPIHLALSDATGFHPIKFE